MSDWSRSMQRCVPLKLKQNDLEKKLDSTKKGGTVTFSITARRIMTFRLKFVRHGDTQHNGIQYKDTQYMTPSITAPSIMIFRITWIIQD
jgi:hypothetical protein